MAKGPRSVDPERTEGSKPRAGSEMPVSPRPYDDVTSSKRAGLSPVTQQRYKKNELSASQAPYTDVRRPARASLHSLEKHSTIDGLTGVSQNQSAADPRLQKRQFDYLNELRLKRLSEAERPNAGAGDSASGTGRSKAPNANEKYIDKLISDRTLNDYEKIEAVKRKANQLEERARQQEKLIQLDKKATAGTEVEVGNEDYSGNVERTMAVNDMYIDAI